VETVPEAAPRLKIVSRHGVGFDNIPVEYCTRRGIPVTIVGHVNAIAVAEQIPFLLLAAARCGVLYATYAALVKLSCNCAGVPLQ
jgi:D-3-phosphoglycerate dehydrogenase / 2-oxoglutarate reductase